MACVALTSLMATIELEFMIPNHRVCVDDENILKSVFEKLSSLEVFLVKEYDNGGAPNRDLEIKIREFALKAEDAIEVQVRNILVDTQHKAHGELHRTLQEVARDTEELLNIINNPSSTNEVDNHSFPLIRWSQPDLHPHNIESGGSLQCSPELHDIIMDEDRLSLFTSMRNYLLNDSDPRRRIFPILGVPGIGKTTFCKKLYADEGIVSYFHIQAWVTIPPPPQYNVHQLLCALLQSMRPTIVNEIDMDSITVSQLKEQLYNHLKGKRYLFVLDNVSNTLLLDDIHQCFPNDSNGSRILLTTSFHHVAKYTGLFWDLSFLGEGESWDLFCHRFSLKQSMAPEFEEIAKCLVEECQGLPLSIVMVAQRLSKCNYTLKEWKKVKKELLSLGTLYADTEHASKLTDIYNQLPQHLKLCFLYLAVFPKGTEIKMDRLIRLLISEGFVKPQWDVPLENIAYEYLEDLWRKSLICFKYKRATSTKVTYYIHNDMHRFCVREAQKEGLLCAVNTRQCIGWPLEVLANSCRWLSLRSHSLDYHVLFSSNIPRSLFFFHGDSEMVVPFKHLRILDFSESLILKRRVSIPLGDLVFLRYLSVPQWFEGLDDVVSTNSNLQTLIVSGIDQSKLGAPTHPFPSKIWELQQLRHLELGDMYTLDPPNMVKGHLHTLCYAVPIHFRKQVYWSFPSIRKLKVLYKDVLEPGCSSRENPIITLESIEGLTWLETLSVIVPVGCITLLERLVFPANLTKLRLSGTNFHVEALKVIGELPTLRVLKLENAFYGKVWEVAKGGFYELDHLVLEAKNLERWVAIGSCFHWLKCLVLRCCYFMEEIPPIIAESGMYLSIVLERCPPSVVTSAKWIQQQRMAKKHPTTVTVDGEILSYPNPEESEDEEDVDDESQHTTTEESAEEDLDDESQYTTTQESEERRLDGAHI